MGKWKYFTDEEVAGILPDLCFKLDRARDLFGNAIVITSGYREPSHNADIGGVADSAHTKGMAVDIRAPLDSFQRGKLCWALGRAGIDRVEYAPRHFHIDIDDSKPTPCFFPGDDK